MGEEEEEEKGREQRELGENKCGFVNRGRRSRPLQVAWLRDKYGSCTAQQPWRVTNSNCTGSGKGVLRKWGSCCTLHENKIIKMDLTYPCVCCVHYRHVLIVHGV